MLRQNGEEVEYLFHALFFDIRENLSKIKFRFNRDLSDNILLRGLPAETERVMRAGTCKGKCAPAARAETDADGTKSK